MRQFIGYLRLVRLSNSLSASALVLVGTYMVITPPFPLRVLIAATAMWAITAFGYMTNDLFDLVEDRINKPNRPIPSGMVNVAHVRYVSGLLAAIALVLSMWLGPFEFLVAFLILSLLTLYNLRLKATAGQGNLLIALLAGCAILVGPIALYERTALHLEVDRLGLLIPPAAVLATFVATREVLKTIEDVEGDRHAGKETIATRWGVRCAIRIVSILAIATSLLGLSLIWILNYSVISLILLLIGVIGPLLYTIIYLEQNTTPSRVQRCLALLKGSYFVGILALLLA
ncbi:geranylgeranylglycerol-phosphate geranylgeranyltransferase [Chloroflexi bacterium TSY]|nr:geranylgeranylglycerol-phosphate geranylgeranyltransferase [Chloroflexi bacterium TSY]